MQGQDKDGAWREQCRWDALFLGTRGRITAAVKKRGGNRRCRLVRTIFWCVAHHLGAVLEVRAPFFVAHPGRPVVGPSPAHGQLGFQDHQGRQQVSAPPVPQVSADRIGRISPAVESGGGNQASVRRNSLDDVVEVLVNDVAILLGISTHGNRTGWGVWVRDTDSRPDQASAIDLQLVQIRRESVRAVEPVRIPHDGVNQDTAGPLVSTQYITVTLR